MVPLPEAITAHGRPVVEIAYAVLQDRGAAERAAAAAFAECWREGTEPGPATATALRAALVAAGARHAVALHGTSREVDPAPRPHAGDLLLLTPPQRAVVALQAVGGFSEEQALEALGLAGRRAQQVVEGLSLLPDERSARERAVSENVRGLPVRLDAAAVQRAIASPPAQGSRGWRRILPPAGGLLLLVLALGLLAQPDIDAGGGTAPAGDVESVEPIEAGEASRPAVARNPRPRAAPFLPANSGQMTLADCGIGPPGADLAFRGWATPHELGTAVTGIPPDRALFALVPMGDVAWNPPGGPRLMPPVRGRLACLADFARSTYVVVGLPAGWSAPE